MKSLRVTGHVFPGMQPVDLRIEYVTARGSMGDSDIPDGTAEVVEVLDWGVSEITRDGVDVKDIFDIARYNYVEELEHWVLHEITFREASQ